MPCSRLFIVMTLQAFSLADRALWVKQRAFSNELTVVLSEAKSETGLRREVFEEKKVILSIIGLKLLLLRKIA